MNKPKTRAELQQQADEAYRAYLEAALEAHKSNDATETAKRYAEWRRLSRLARWSNDGTPECGE